MEAELCIESTSPARPLALTEVEVYGPEEKAEPETAPAPEEVE